MSKIRYIGQGRTRDVYEIEGMIMKINRSEDNTNKAEWENWNKVKGTELEPYFMPCTALINDKILFMPKAEEMTTAEKEKPLMLPKMMQDLKRHNFMKHEGRIVQIDYPYTIKHSTEIKQRELR